MILFYSASGNTEYVARTLAKMLGDECIDLLDRIKKSDFTRIYSKKPFVICTPVYVCDMPFFIRNYIKKLPFRGSREVYYVFTSGGYAGISGLSAKKLTKRKNMIYKGHAELKMPSNHIVSNAYPETEPDECIKRIKDCTAKAAEIADTIRQHGRLRARHIFLFEKAIAVPVGYYWIRYKQPSKDFYTTDKCVGCGKCSRLCPVNNIEMYKKRPVWKAPCAHCMACISNCPFEAIEYADITQKKIKYNISKYTDMTKLRKSQTRRQVQ